MEAYKKTAEPALEPITLREAKMHLGESMDSTHNDPLIKSALSAAREKYEQLTNLVMITTSYEMYLDNFRDVIKIMRVPVQEVTSIKYTDTNGTEQTLSAANYQADIYSMPARIIPAYGMSWPSVKPGLNRVKITFKAGYGDAQAAVDRLHKQAILLMMAHYYENREDVIVGRISTEIPGTSRDIINMVKITEFI